MDTHRYADSPSQRVFPPIEPDIYDLSHELAELTPDQRVARKLLALANQKFTIGERLAGWKLDSTSLVGRLLLQHRLAMEAELAAQWNRADFFWNQVQIEFNALSKRDDVWQSLVLAVASEPGVVVMGEPRQLRQRLVDELLIDTHFVFYEGLAKQVEKLSLKDRAFIHIDYIQKLLNFSARFQEELLSMLKLPWEQQLDLYKEAKKWKPAIELCTERLKHFPKSVNYQNELAEVYFSATLAKLNNGNSEAKQLKDAKTLQGGIARLEKFSNDYPYNLIAFELLGHLHHLRAIKLGNGGRVAEALVEVQKAMIHNPYIKQATETRNELVRMMNQLQTQVENIPYNVTLNQEGKRLLAEANKGFAPMNAYTKSAAAKATIYAFNTAQAISIWQAIGLAEPEAETNTGSPALMLTTNRQELPTESTTGWSRQALLLLDALNCVGNNPPRSKWGLADAWEAVVSKQPELAQLDHKLIHAFLDRRLFGSTQEPVTPKTPVPPPEPLRFTPPSTKRKRGVEPFVPWLFSRQDIRIKVQAVVASVLVLTAVALARRDASIRSARDAAYQQILKAEQQQNYLGVVQGAEKFFEHTPLSGKDGRDRQVMELYTEALVRWFAQQGDQLDTNTKVHLDRYRAVMSSAEQGADQP
jgi:hypothetical protein